jgi:ABC-type multidrug transport system ATPase subunit
LDREAAKQLEVMLRRLAEENEMLILVASHDSSFLQRLAPRVFTISDGRLAEEESSPNRLIRITLSGSLPTNVKLPNCVRYYQEHGSLVLLGRISDASFYVSLGGLLNEGGEISRLEVDGCWGEGR